MPSPETLQFVRDTPFVYGKWRAFKSLYKQAESAASDPTLLGALFARLDAAPLSERLPMPPAADLGDANIWRVTGVAARDGRLFVLENVRGDSDRLAVFASHSPDPLKPQRLGSAAVLNPIAVFLLEGDSVIVARGGQQHRILQLFDVSDPARPTPRGNVNIAGLVAAAAGGTRLCAAVNKTGIEAFEGLRVIDAGELDAPKIVGEVKIENVNGVALNGNLACVTVGRVGFGWTHLPKPGGLRVVDVTDASRPKIIGALGTGDVSAVAMAGNFALLGLTGSLQIVDISAPTRPRALADCALPGHPTSITVQGSLAFVTLAYGSLQVVDISSPEQPRVVGKLAQNFQKLAIDRTRAYLTGGWNGGLSVVNLERPATPTLIGTPPSSETLAYMKRRARRFLRQLAKRDADSYVAVAFETLRAADKTESLDLQTQWVLTDILFGGTTRFSQTRHGRGGYVERDAKRPIRAREERAPEAWSRRPDLAAALFSAPNLPWQTFDFALKILRANRTTPPDVDESSLRRFLQAPSPLLVHAATGQIAARMAAGSVPAADLTADAFLLSGRARRQVIADALPRHAGAEDWRREFGTRLLQMTAGAGLTRRTLGPLLLLARDFSEGMDAADVLPLAGALLSAGRAELTELALAGARRADPKTALDWLRATASSEAALSALEAAMRGQSFDAATARALTHDADEIVRVGGWRLLAASATPTEVLSPLWLSLLDGLTETPILQTAMASPAALSLWERAGIDADALTSRLPDRPFLVGLLSPPTFLALSRSVPAAVTLRLISVAPDELWARLRPAWLRDLREGVGLEDLWLAAEAALSEAADDRLERRLLGDEEVAETLLGVNNLAILSLRDAAFGPMLARWAAARADEFAANSALLLQAATHPLPAVRDWALARASSFGLSLPFALRLLESNLPSSVQAGWAFFAAAPPADRREFDYALALCDSPQKSVRARGRAFVESRWPTLPHAALLRALFQNSHADMQAFVAEKLADAAERPAETPAFDRDVLRARGQSRRAKESIKTRQSAEPTLDADTLLTLARGRAGRDSEWALAELAKRALAGEAVDGFSTDGVAGI